MSSEDVLIEQYFEIFDKDGDKRISNKELKKILKVIYKTNLREDEIGQVLAKYDADDSGTLDLNEFKQLYHSLTCTCKPKGASLKEMFRAYDTDGDNSLSKDEVRRFLEEIDSNQVVTEDQVTKLMSDTDIDNSGTVSFPEFCRMFVLLESKGSNH